MIHVGDCVEVMATLPEASVDAIVTDPPYGLEFMGKTWDLVSQEWHGHWASTALRVAKPGAYLLSFGGTRTVHRLTCALEDAGWIIRDTLIWAYASGFPKSRALLKPAWEPIVMARKPGPLRELRIDDCRIEWGDDKPSQAEWNRAGSSGQPGANGHAGQFSEGLKRAYSEGLIPVPSGRWPANIILTDPPIFEGDTPGVVGEGTYSRFFLIPKASRSEREPAIPSAIPGQMAGVIGDDLTPGKNVTRPRVNTHPTVKPVELMRHLVRLVTPSDGTVLDPFLGSGTTAIAAEMEGRAWIGIEREPEYVRIAEARLAGVQRGMGLETVA